MFKTTRNEKGGKVPNRMPVSKLEKRHSYTSGKPIAGE